MYQNAPPHYNQGYASPGPPPQSQYGGGGYNNGYSDNNNMNQHPPPAYPGGGGGNGGGGGGFGAPSPVNAAYQRANAAMAGLPPGRAPSPTPNSVSNNSASGGVASSTGLIRLTLRKPMGIVFEPMTDPHNPSQQRGVRICDLPRTGAAAMSQKLEVGDELLSINDKTMSRLTFDEIMDFIIEADKERVDLLFRRPGKDKLKNGGDEGRGGNANAPPGPAGAGAPLSPMGLGGIGSNSNSVKWIDEKSDIGGKLAEDVQPDRGDSHRNNNDRNRDGRDNRGGGSGKNQQTRQDDPSVDDTYNDGYTVESQSQYTMETYEEDRGGGRGRGGRGGDSSRYSDADYSKDAYGKDDKKPGSSSRRNNKNERDRDGTRGKDPVESTGFLDLLIDTLCTSVMGRDARDMCGDRAETDKKGDGGSGHDMKNKGGYPDEDDEFTVDDGTYATYEENDHRGNNNMNRDRNNQRHHGHQDEDEGTFITNEDEGTFITNEDDGTRTLESKDVMAKKNQHPINEHNMHNEPKKGKDKKSSSKSMSKEQEISPYNDNGEDRGYNNNAPIDNDPNQFQRSDPPPHHHGGPNTAPDPPTKAGPSQQQHQHHQHQHQHPPPGQEQQQYQPQMDFDHQMNEQESAIASGIALPVKELEYDTENYAADVSVMESLGGPSLLVERARHENAVSTGADRASFENLDRQDPELAELIARHSEGFLPERGMTKEETAFRDPYKFYEHAVCNLLRDNEPEKVRLLSKLMAKYRGRERHLINKLSARYNKDKSANDGGNNASNGGAGEQAAPNIESSRSKSSAGPSDNASSGNNLNNKTSMSGMEKIQEAGDEEETAGSSVLNDPSRANMAAIETAKKKLESSEGNISLNNKASKESPPKASKPASNAIDGWPPAMADPWGTGSPPEVPKEPIHNSPPPAAVEHHHHDMDAGSRPSHFEHDDEGSYSDDGSSYSGEDESQGVDGTSPAIIAQVSELLNYVYGKTSVAGQIDRVSTIMRAYEGREAVLLELLETKALIKANADSNWDTSDLPVSLRNSPGLNNNNNGGGSNNQGQQQGGSDGISNAESHNLSDKKLNPQTPVSVLTTPTLVEYPASSGGSNKPLSPESVVSPKEAMSPSAGTMNTFNTAQTNASSATKKKKKGIFGGFFKGKKDKKGNFPSGNTAGSDAVNTKSSPGKAARKKMSKKGQPLNDDDRSI